MSKQRSVVLSVEQLEDRCVPSATPLVFGPGPGAPIVLPPGPITPPPLPVPAGQSPVVFPPVPANSPPPLVPQRTPPTLPTFPEQQEVVFPSTVSLGSMEWLASQLANQFAQSHQDSGLHINSVTKPTSSGGSVLAYTEQDRGNSLRINLTQQTVQGQQVDTLTFTEKDGNATVQFTFTQTIPASGRATEQFNFVERSPSANDHFHLGNRGSPSGHGKR